MSCERTRTLLDRLDADGSGSAALIGHLEGCAACRAEAVERDPSLLFALGARTPPQPDWTGFNAAVREGIERDRRRAGWPGRLLDTGVFAPRRFVPALAAAAAVVVLVAGLWQAGRGVTAPPVPVAASAPDTAVGFTPLPAPVESVASPTARVVHMQIEEQEEPGDFVLILDEGIDL